MTHLVPGERRHAVAGAHSVEGAPMCITGLHSHWPGIAPHPLHCCEAAAGPEHVRS